MGYGLSDSAAVQCTVVMARHSHTGPEGGGRRFGGLMAGNGRESRRPPPAMSTQLNVCARDEESGSVVGAASAAVDRIGEAEITVWVLDPFQDLGLGGVLLGELAHRLSEVGVVQVHASTEASSAATVALLCGLGAAPRPLRRGDRICVVVGLPNGVRRTSGGSDRH
jgi:hypothetical protein